MYIFTLNNFADDNKLRGVILILGQLRVIPSTRRGWKENGLKAALLRRSWQCLWKRSSI